MQGLRLVSSEARTDFFFSCKTCKHIYKPCDLARLRRFTTTKLVLNTITAVIRGEIILGDFVHLQGSKGLDLVKK